MVKYLIMDIDGSLTDGKIYMGTKGEIVKAFSVKDGYVFNYILKPLGITPIVITARESIIVQTRCDELGIKDIYQGKLDKIAVLYEIIGKDNIGNCAYFGDDILDLKCMRLIRGAGGIVGAPFDAVSDVKAVANYVCKNVAGSGALREFVEWILSPQVNLILLNDKINNAISYLKDISIKSKSVGKYLVNEDFFYLVQEYDTKLYDNCIFESHRKYIDIQIVISGSEQIKISDTSRLFIKQEYDEYNDIVLWEKPDQSMSVSLNEGSVIVLFPENAHCGGIANQNICRVKKIVGKILYR